MVGKCNNFMLYLAPALCLFTYKSIMQVMLLVTDLSVSDIYISLRLLFFFAKQLRIYFRNSVKHRQSQNKILYW